MPPRERNTFGTCARRTTPACFVPIFCLFCKVKHGLGDGVSDEGGEHFFVAH